MEEKVVVTSNTTTVTKSNNITNAVLLDKTESETKLGAGVEESSSNSTTLKIKKMKKRRRKDHEDYNTNNTLSSSKLKKDSDKKKGRMKNRTKTKAKTKNVDSSSSSCSSVSWIRKDAKQRALQILKRSLSLPDNDDDDDEDDIEKNDNNKGNTTRPNSTTSNIDESIIVTPSLVSTSSAIFDNYNNHSFASKSNTHQLQQQQQQQSPSSYCAVPTPPTGPLFILASASSDGPWRDQIKNNSSNINRDNLNNKNLVILEPALDGEYVGQTLAMNLEKVIVSQDKDNRNRLIHHKKATTTTTTTTNTTTTTTNTATALASIILYGISTLPPSKSTSSSPLDNDPLQKILSLTSQSPRKVCQKPFLKNDLVWICRTCQVDETCVLCHECYSNSNHDGHDVGFYHSPSGGCCDCGDVDAWDSKGFCERHGCSSNSGDGDGSNSSISNNGEMEQILGREITARAKGVIDACTHYLVNVVAGTAKRSEERVWGSGNNNNSGNNSESGSGDKNGTTRGGNEDNNNNNDDANDDNGNENKGKKGKMEAVGKDGINRYAIRSIPLLSSSISSTTNSIMNTSNDLTTPPPPPPPITIPIPNPSNNNNNRHTKMFLTQRHNHRNKNNRMKKDDDEEEEEAFFDPGAASSSKSRRFQNNNSNSNNNNTTYSTLASPIIQGHGYNIGTTFGGVFDPNAASTSSPKKNAASASSTITTHVSSTTAIGTTKTKPSKNLKLTPTQRLGLLGARQKGLYIILHYNECRSDNDVISLFSDLYSPCSSTPYYHDNNNNNNNNNINLHHNAVYDREDNRNNIANTAANTAVFASNTDPVTTTTAATTTASRHPRSIYRHRLRNNITTIMHPSDRGPSRQLLTQTVSLLPKLGEIIVYGTHELISILGPGPMTCWRFVGDGDYERCENVNDNDSRIVAGRFGNLIRDKARMLALSGNDSSLTVSTGTGIYNQQSYNNNNNDNNNNNHSSSSIITKASPAKKMAVFIKTGQELRGEARAGSVIGFLRTLADGCDSLCVLVGEGLICSSSRDCDGVYDNGSSDDDDDSDEENDYHCIGKEEVYDDENDQGHYFSTNSFFESSSSSSSSLSSSSSSSSSSTTILSNTNTDWRDEGDNHFDDTDDDVKDVAKNGIMIKECNDNKNDKIGESNNKSIRPKDDERSRRISKSGLSLLLQYDLRIPRVLASSWHELLLTLLAVPSFKSALAVSYCDTYPIVSSEYASGSLGTPDRGSFMLAVQFLNRANYVRDLVRGERDILGVLSRSLLTMVETAMIPLQQQISSSFPEIPSPSSSFSSLLSPSPIQILNAMHPIVFHRRYAPLISDLKCVLGVKGVPRLFVGRNTYSSHHSQTSIRPTSIEEEKSEPTCLEAWIKALTLCQNLDGQSWRSPAEGAMAYELKGWAGSFNMCISIGSLFEKIVNWEDNELSPIVDCNNKSKPSPYCLLTMCDLTEVVLLTGIAPWQRAEAVQIAATITSSLSTPESLNPSPFFNPHTSCTSFLPTLTIASKFGVPQNIETLLPLPQDGMWSFHLPLHRFAAFCLKEGVSRRQDNACNSGIEGLILRLLRKYNDKNGTMNKSDDVTSLLRGLMEFPVIILSRTAQIKAGLWKRNGIRMQEQVFAYAEPPYCSVLRDADLTLIQFALVGGIRLDMETSFLASSFSSPIGTAFFVNLLLHRFGVFDFIRFIKSPDLNVDAYRKGSNESCLISSKETSVMLQMLEELLNVLIVLVTELPPPPPKDKSHAISQTKSRICRELVHRLVSGPKTHSEMNDIHQVLSQRENNLMDETGQNVNSKTSGVSIEDLLSSIANRKKMKIGVADTWEIRHDEWDNYDPAFFHISLRSHQIAQENRPLARCLKQSDKFVSKPYSPKPPLAHRAFKRLRKDITSDSCIIALCYRTLYMHCRLTKDDVEHSSDLKERCVRETLVSKVIHLLTLGAYAWGEIDTLKDETPPAMMSVNSWQEGGGGGKGCIFFHFTTPPSVSNWVESVLIRDPLEIMGINYQGKENILALLNRLAVSGGSKGLFHVSDMAIRAGASWICEFAKSHSNIAASQLDSSQDPKEDISRKAEMQKRKQDAQKRAINQMQMSIAKFEDMVVNEGENKLTSPPESQDCTPSEASITAASKQSAVKQVQSSIFQTFDNFPRCVICREDSTAVSLADDKNCTGDKSSKKVLAFCGYVQASTVLKGGGVLEMSNLSSCVSSVRKCLGTHLSTCGHAVHNTCFDLYLKNVARRDEHKENLGRTEFICPLCTQLSNCLVPFVDIGTDWVVEAPCTPRKSGGLHNFLNTSKWWTQRNDKSVIWDRRCTFIPLTKKSQIKKSSENKVRFFGSRKDLFLSWNSIFTRTGKYGKNQSQDDESLHEIIESKTSHGSGGLTKVWRNLMDQVSDIPSKADLQRLGEIRILSQGESTFINNFGEFRHYVIEKHVFNNLNRKAGNDMIEWPVCIQGEDTLSDQQKQELLKEKLVSKLFLVIQAFTYSVAAEGAEFMRLSMELISSSNTQDPSIDKLYLKYGVRRLICEGNLIVLPSPFSSKDGKCQLFDGRIGKLKYYAIAIMAATSALSREIVHLAFDFPEISSDAKEFPEKARAPITFPLLSGHILTHVVAALCAVCGHERAVSDSLNLTSSSLNNDTCVKGKSQSILSVKNTVHECEYIIQLGFLAKTLQVLLGVFQYVLLDEVDIHVLDRTMKWESKLEFYLMQLSQRKCANGNLNDIKWNEFCSLLLLEALKTFDNRESCIDLLQEDELEIMDLLFIEACVLSKESAIAYLCDTGLILQILVPGKAKELHNTLNLHQDSQKQNTLLNSIANHFGIDAFKELLQSPLVCQIINNWYKSARLKNKQKDIEKGLDCIRKFTPIDWPIVMNKNRNKCSIDQLDTLRYHKVCNTKIRLPQYKTFKGTENNVPLIGALRFNNLELGEVEPQLKGIPNSYTDLYAHLTALSPHSELIALCLVCGKILDAGGKGQCTKHALKCGGGCGIFFLLQECKTLIIHNKRAAYVHSPFVDTHGETGEYRGKPLNLNIDRYSVLQELWFGHLVRQKVISERETSRQFILNNYY